MELYSPLLTLQLEAEQFLREADQEVLNRRERWVELNSSLLTLQLEAEQFLREAEQEVLNRR